MQTGPDAVGLRDLIARVRAATSQDPELDAEILCALLAPAGSEVHQSRINGAWCVFLPNGRLWEKPSPWREDHASLTDSIDAALALVKRVLPDRRVHFSISTGGRLPADASLSINRTPDEIASAHLMRPDDDPAEGFEGYVMEGALHSATSASLAILLALLTTLASQRETGGEHVG